MPAKRSLLTVRVRRDSALERLTESKKAQMPDLVHSWAEKDEQGWSEQFALSKRGEK